MAPLGGGSTSIRTEYRIWWSTGNRSVVKDCDVGDTIGEHARVGVSVVAMDTRQVTDWEVMPPAKSAARVDRNEENLRRLHERREREKDLYDRLAEND